MWVSEIADSFTITACLWVIWLAPMLRLILKDEIKRRGLK